MRRGVRERGHGEAAGLRELLHCCHSRRAPRAAAAVGGSQGVCRGRERLASVLISNETNTSCFSLNQSDHRAEPKLIHS